MPQIIGLAQHHCLAVMDASRQLFEQYLAVGTTSDEHQPDADEEQTGASRLWNGGDGDVVHAKLCGNVWRRSAGGNGTWAMHQIQRCYILHYSGKVVAGEVCGIKREGDACPTTSRRHIYGADCSQTSA